MKCPCGWWVSQCRALFSPTDILEAESGYDENCGDGGCVWHRWVGWRMDKIVRKVAHHIDIPGKHALGKNVMNILEGSVRNVTKTGKKTQKD